MDALNEYLKEYYIIYFDILGYKQYFEENKDHQQLLHDIKGMIVDIANDMNLYGILNGKDIKIRVFSDNVIICVEDVVNFNVDALGIIVANLQIKIFLKYGLLLRGAYTKGKFYYDSNFVYGAGLIKAVEIESKAKYPRIICDLISRGDKGFAMDSIFLKDNDEKIYLNYFDKNLIENDLSLLKEKVSLRIKKYGKYPPNIKDENKIKVYESIIQKTLWVVEKFNEACEKISKPEEKINYRVLIEKKLLKMELSLAEKA